MFDPYIVYLYNVNDTSAELSVFWQSDIESQINKLRFSGSLSLSFKMRLTSVTCKALFAEMLHKVDFKLGTRDGKT